MKIEFLKDSDELKQFVESCRVLDDVNHEGGEDAGGTFFDRIYQTADHQKCYSVECFSKYGRIRESIKFVGRRRDFKASEPYVVIFTQVTPVEVVTTVWEEVTE